MTRTFKPVTTLFNCYGLCSYHAWTMTPAKCASSISNTSKGSNLKLFLRGHGSHGGTYARSVQVVRLSGLTRAATYLGLTCEGALPKALDPLRSYFGPGEGWAGG